MFALVVLGLVASASTAAWYDPYVYNNGFQLGMDRFWDNFNRQMDDLDKKIENVVKHSKNRGSRSGIDGDEYKITIYLTGFNMEDIVVTAKKGNLVIKAIHNVPGESANSYLDVRDLPDFVDENGSWSYNNNVLTLVFPIIQRGSDDTTVSILPYGNNENDNPSENSNSDEDVIRGNLENSDNTGGSQIASGPNQYDYKEAFQPAENDVEN